MQFGKLSQCTLLAALAGVFFCPQPASAGQGYVMAGIGGGPDALDSWQGVIYAPLAGLSQSGPLLRAFNKTYRFQYKTTLPARKNATIHALGFSLEAQGGWQLAKEGLGRIALYGGIVWRDHILTPADPGSNLAKARLGFSASIDGEYTINNDFGVMTNASFVTGFDQYWAEARPFIDFGGGWKAGPEIAAFGGKGYDIARLGLFTSGYEVPLGKWGRIFLGGQMGARFSIRHHHITPYGGINMGFLF